jgi:hypothetical protein
MKVLRSIAGHFSSAWLPISCMRRRLFLVANWRSCGNSLANLNSFRTRHACKRHSFAGLATVGAAGLPSNCSATHVGEMANSTRVGEIGYSDRGNFETSKYCTRRYETKGSFACVQQQPSDEWRRGTQMLNNCAKALRRCSPENKSRGAHLLENSRC